MGLQALDVLADRGYFDGEEVLACEAIGVTPYVSSAARFITTPMRRNRSACWACAAKGDSAATPAIFVSSALRLIRPSKTDTRNQRLPIAHRGAPV